MSPLVAGLTQALRSLPKADKAKVVERLLEDAEIREVVAEFLVRRLGEPAATPGSPASSPQALPGLPAFPSSAGHDAALTPRERGKRLREHYLADLAQKGIPLHHAGGIWAKTADGLWVAVPCATEVNRNAWFPGLTENELFQKKSHEAKVAVVLLCQARSGAVLDCVLPPQKVREMVPRLSKSRGQVKFNLKKAGNRYLLGMRSGVEPLDVTEYMGATAIFSVRAGP
ncbi:MAG: hypothetical protein HY687_01270 [Chloroflexi bacterium]|nr:hypothetical protein [Chloroflexota bacterium]